MAEPRTYPHGVTCWIDTEQHDPQAASRFYAGLFGWTLTDAGAPGSYLVATLDGRDAAAIAPTSAATAVWNTYVAVDDADATAAAVTAAGGTVVAAPADNGAGARVAVCTDPAGAGFRLWQAGGRPGAQVANAPGAWNFSDLHTPDRDAAMAFYTPVFGWRAVDLAQGAGTMIQVPGYGDHLAATVDPGIHERQDGIGAPPGFADAIGWVATTQEGEEPHWHVTFTVEDRDASVEAVQRLGGSIVRTSDSDWTREALVDDPAGARFTLSQFTPQG